LLYAAAARRRFDDDVSRVRAALRAAALRTCGPFVRAALRAAALRALEDRRFAADLACRDNAV
jgi:hypothetical protein